MSREDFIINNEDQILISGANGFIGSRVVAMLLSYGFRKLRCFVRPSSNVTNLNEINASLNTDKIEIIKGNLLSRADCENAVRGVSIIYHLAVGDDKSYPGAFMNSVVTTRNLLEATLKDNHIKRFVNISSFTVYSNIKLRPGALLDETCEVYRNPELEGEAYCYAKVKQDELVKEYSKNYNLPYVIVRPGAVYGPGRKVLTQRVGIGTFGVFLHLGGSNRIPLTYVDNCAEAIVLAGLKQGVESEAFNVVDDDLPTSRQFLKMYKNNVENFKSIYVPKIVSCFLCYLWEKYSKWSEGQLTPVFNRIRWSADWKGNRYSNEKLKKLLGWKPTIPYDEASRRFIEYCRAKRDSE